MIPRLALALLLALPAFAELSTSALTGEVTVSGAPAADVTVTVTSAALRHPRTTSTNARGTYFLDALPPGQYDVTFSRAGLTTLTRRAVVQLMRVARADAALEESVEEESVTSTATTPSVADTTAIATHADDHLLDRLPVRREVFGALLVAPRTVTPAAATVDDLPLGAPQLVSEEALEQTTFVRGAVPVELEGPRIVARTRSGRDQLFLSLRDTITSARWIDGRLPGRDTSDAIRHHIDLAAGGRIVPGRFWFFGSAWTGDEADAARDDQRGLHLKLDAAPSAAHHLTASHFDARFARGVTAADVTTSALRYTGVGGPRFVLDAQLSRTPAYNPGSFARESFHTLSTRASWAGGDHVVTGGGTALRFAGQTYWSVFAADRWSVDRWTVYAGLRHQESPFLRETLPRVAVSYDLRGDGRRALFASYSEYAELVSARRVASVGYAMTLGATGHARADASRTDVHGRHLYDVQLEARYRLFDRLEAGGNYSYVDGGMAANHAASGWLGIELPVGRHEFGATVLQRIVSGEFAPAAQQTVAPTDVALRYSIPFTRIRLTLAADARNVFAVSRAGGRDLRFWIRARM